MVAPADPVPLNRKTTRAGSPLGYSNDRIKPCLETEEPSTGSVYLILKIEDSCQSLCFYSHQCIAMITYPNSSAAANLMPEPSSFAVETPPSTKLLTMRSITLLAASLSTAAKKIN